MSVPESTIRIREKAEASVEEISAEVTQVLPWRTVHSVVVLGLRTPTMAFARRCRDAGMRVNLIEFVFPEELGKRGLFKQPTKAIEGLPEQLAWPLVGSEEGFQRICSYLHRVGADVVLSVDEFTQEWLALRRAELPEGCRLLAPEVDVLVRLLDKLHQVKRARDAGFSVLPTWELPSLAEVGGIPANEYPVCVRPTQVNSIQPQLKAAVFESPSKLVATLSGYEWTSPLAVQPFRYGPNFVLHAVRSADGEMLSIRLFKAERKCQGFASTLVEAPLPQTLAAAATRFAEAEKIAGPFHFDLLQPEGTDEFLYLEVNVRLGGTTAKVLELGMDEPLLTLQAFHTKPPQMPVALQSVGRVTTMSLELRRAWKELVGKADSLAYPRFSGVMGAIRALWEAVAVRDSLVSIRDWRGSLYFLIRGQR